MPMQESRVIFEIDESGKRVGTPSVSEDGGELNGDHSGEPSIDEGEEMDRLKRLAGSLEGSGDHKRRRFLWPESLHKDFVAAIFDIGIRNGSPDHLFDLMCQEDPRCAAFVNANGILDHLNRCQGLRDRLNPHYWSYYEKSLLNGNDTPINHYRVFNEDHSADETALNEGNLGFEQKLFLLRKQLHLIDDTIQIQFKFLYSVKAAMESQLKTQAKIIQVISSLDQSYAKQLQSNNQRQQQLLSSLPMYSDSNTSHPLNDTASSRVELQIMSDMRTHMDLHRQLMLRKDNQVSQFSGKVNSTEDVPVEREPPVQEWSWDEENLDTHLFSFLDEP